MKKIMVIAMAVLLIAVESLGACTIFCVGKKATVDGSTMTSHVCDSNTDDPRLWIIPSFPAGTERDVVLDGREGADYSQFPEVKNYGLRGLVLGSETYTEDTYQYLHSMYSFMNEKGLSMGECTNNFDRSSEQGQKLEAAYAETEGVLDLYCLQDMVFETCATAREAVQYMGEMIEKYGWWGWAETLNITDGEESWVFEVYGGPVWCAARVPDDMVFIAANRSRLRYINFNDTDHVDYYWFKDIKQWALDYDLWDGKSEFAPCKIFAPYASFGCTLREWRCLTMLDPSLDIDPYSDADTWPIFVKPAKKLSVADIHRMCSDYYQGTEFDCSRTLMSGELHNPLSPHNVYRPINMYRCTYIQISNVKSWLPDEAKALVWFGWGAPSTTYLTPIFVNSKSLPAHFGKADRMAPWSADSGFWVSTGVQQTCTANYEAGIKYIEAARDSQMEAVYEQTAKVQDLVASMVNVGMREEAVNYITDYTAFTANNWLERWLKLDNELRSILMFGCHKMVVPKWSDWWWQLTESNLDNLRPLDDSCFR